MALNGTLADLGIVDLVQFPHAGRKTGELSIVASGRTARLYYSDGVLTHAEAEQLEGMDALVQVVDLEQGEFEFRQDVTAERQTIEMDLHRAVMLALKTRDEKRLEEQRRPGGDGGNGVANSSEVEKRFSAFLRSTPFAEHAVLLSFNGEIIAHTASASAGSDGVEELMVVVHDVRRNYPRAGLSRVILEDSIGTVATTQLEDGRAVVLVASHQAPMGAITVALKKLAEQLEGAA